MAGIAFLVQLTLVAQGSGLSPAAQVSVITCGPGTELYSTFGHSAFRIKDPVSGLDRVYNYGTFNFNTPNFYVKFARGKLLYELRAYDFGNFLRGYHEENRWVKEQVLDLKNDQIQKVFDFLENNAKPENRAYKYDFFYDNCSTKMMDVLEQVLGSDLVFDPNFEKAEYTHRQLIQMYLGDLPWSDFGIDLALGSVIDREIQSKAYMFLPDYVLQGVDASGIKEAGKIKPLVKETNTILDSKPLINKGWIITPFWLFTILAVAVILISIRDFKKRRRNKLLDYILFFSTGITGLVILLLWFATDHSATANNLNILWAFAPNLVFALILHQNRSYYAHYMLFLLALLDLVAVLWIARIQVFSIALLPLLVMLNARYIYLWLYFKYRGTSGKK